MTAAETDGNVDLAFAAAYALARYAAECEYAEVDVGQHLYIAAGAVNDDAGPSLIAGGGRDHVADQGVAQRAAAVDHQHTAVALSREQLLDARVVLEALDGRDRAAEPVAAAVGFPARPVSDLLESTLQGRLPARRGMLCVRRAVLLVSRLDFNTADHVRRGDSQVLVIRSAEDEIIPFHHGRRLHETAGHRATMLEIQGGHNTGFLESKQHYSAGLDLFIDRVSGSDRWIPF